MVMQRSKQTEPGRANFRRAPRFATFPSDWHVGRVEVRTTDEGSEQVAASDAGSPPDPEFVEFVGARQHTLLRAAFLVCGDLRLAEDLLRRALVWLAGEWDRVRDERREVEVRRTLYRDAVASWRRRPSADAVTAAGSRDAEVVEPDWQVPAWGEPSWGDPDWTSSDGGGHDEESDDEGGEDAEDAEDAERRRAVLRALDTLTPRQRAVVVLQFFEDRGEPDTADILGTSVGAVHVAAGEAVMALRSALRSADLEIGGAR